MFHVEWTDDVQTIVIEARGATIGSAEQRNSDYTEGLELVLRRLGRAGFQLADAFVDSRDTQSLPRADQRLAVGADYPITIADAAELRRLMGAAQARVGREEGA
ncbi:MAG: hypothetical protein FJ104_05575, partial [Deltaproteobacteria bacterium]|nr:hypothetical protein [Deltaproteobacteria bacterium]